MSGSTAKQKVLEAMEKLPADATLEDAIERLCSWRKSSGGWPSSMRDKGWNIARQSVGSSGDPDHLGSAGHRGR